MKKFSGIIALAAAALMLSCGGGKYEYPFQNPKLKVDKRVDNLMSLLTPEETRTVSHFRMERGTSLEML